MNKYASILLLLPVICAAFSCMGYHYAFHVGVPVSCSLIVGLFHDRGIGRTLWFIVLSFLVSIGGDWMLRTRGVDGMRFIYGIGLYFISHVCYLIFCLKNGKINRLFLSLLLVVYLPFFVWCLMPAIPDRLLLVSVFFYLIISCVSLAAAFGLRLSNVSRYLFTVGIGCLVFSDTLIAFKEFLHIGSHYYLMFPAFYASQILITAALIRAK
ncbi:lysoplasmalogenase [Parabacteroides sp. OttesenSCG-928-G07]|nr:lysoplasmalogenase [Parabacteroides sp. OttesenSCG-928-G21]MDL2277040.1 lysoplasmalogenase [Parabacteroides sp. OttesenSCG-928-G07]